MNPSSPNIPASIRQRLLNLSRERGEEFQRILDRYSIERLLYRLSISSWSEQFLLKGAMLFLLWNESLHRPTRDLDLLGFGTPEVEGIKDIFRAIATEKIDDGILFDADSVMAGPIREDALYAGVRVRLLADLAGANVSMQIDIGFGDAVFPAPLSVVFPTLLDLPAPKLRVYPIETVIAEKFEALVVLGIQNSRMKDFFDLWTIAVSIAA